MILRARIVLPVSRPPIENGAVTVAGDSIQSVGPWEGSAQGHFVVDLGDVILLPGLVNAHSHLDYTSMAGQIPRPRTFPDWIGAILGIKQTWTEADYLASWLEGMRMLVLSGTTTVADNEAVPAVLREALPATPLRVFTFLEVLSPRTGPPAPEEVLSKALGQVPFLEPQANEGGGSARFRAVPVGGVNPGWRFGLAPHAPYSTTPGLLSACSRAAVANGWRVMSHVAESQSEFDMFMYSHGPMYDWLKGVRDMGDCGRGSPLRAYRAMDIPRETFLAVHMNYLWHDDAEVLAREGASVVHCPRSHRYFEHRRFPRAALEAAGVNVCLGTDSLATVARPRSGSLELNLFTEMQTLAAYDSQISPETILRMATVRGAAALGLKGVVGEIAPGVGADLIVLHSHTPISHAYEAAVHHTGPVRGVMVAGKWIVPPLPLEPDPSLPCLAADARRGASR